MNLTAESVITLKSQVREEARGRLIIHLEAVLAEANESETPVPLFVVERLSEILVGGEKLNNFCKVVSLKDLAEPPIEGGKYSHDAKAFIFLSAGNMPVEELISETLTELRQDIQTLLKSIEVLTAPVVLQEISV